MSERTLVSAFGAVVEIDASALDGETQGRVTAAWSSTRPIDHREPTKVVRVRQAGDTREVLENLAADIVLAAQNGSLGDFWMLRAGALIDAEGRVVVICGPSDHRDVVALDSISERFPGAFEGIIGIDTVGGVTPISVAFSSAAADDDMTPPAVLRLARIVLLDCADDAPEIPQVDVLELGEALVPLVAESKHLCESRAPLRSIVALLHGTGGAVRIRYRAATSLKSLIAELTESTPAEIVVPTRTSGTVPLQCAAVDAERIYRGEAADSCLLPGGRLALLKSETTGNGRLRILDALESAVWCSANGVARDDIVDSAVRERGLESDPDAAQRVARVVSELSAEGWLSREPAWQVEEDTAWVSSDNRATVLNLASPSQLPLALEGSAHVVWDIVARSRSISQGAIIEKTAAHFGAENGEVAGGVVNLLHDLAASGAVSQM